MKRILLLAAFISCIFAACQQSNKKNNNLLGKDKLPAQFFSVNINKDTTLATANGAFISIPQGAFSGANNETVQLEIKEAYSMEQIIMAGLTTQSNGQPLSSGGMIYINAAGGQSIKITKTLSIKIPTPSINRKMELFKGDPDANGNINWVEPDSLPANAQTIALNNGRMLFSNNCAACHDISKEGTGSALAHILARTPDKKLLYEYTRNNRKVMAEGNQYYRCLYEKYNKTAMNTFQSLTDQDLDSLYGYIENESKARNFAVPVDEIRPCIDSCRIYREIKNKLESEKNKLSKEKVDMVIEEIVNPPVSITQGNATNTLPPPVSNQVQPVYNQSLFYQFKIEAFGWYNIDMQMKDPTSVESSLLVRIRGAYKQNINIYLVIPASKVLLDGGLLEGKTDDYGFDTKDGKITLPQNIRAYVFALGEFEDKIIFSKQAFTTSTKQEFEMTLSVVSKDFFNASIKSLSLPGLQVSVDKTKNADTLRKIINDLKDVEKIKPKKCDCNCGLWPEVEPLEYLDLRDTTVSYNIPKQVRK